MRSTGRSTRTRSCIRWCAGSSRAACPRTQRRAFLFTNVVGADGRKLRHARRGRRARGLAEIYAHGHGRDGRGDRRRVDRARIDNPIPPVRVENAAVPGGRHHGRRPAQARRRPVGVCRCRSRRPASTPRPISPRRCCVTKDPETGVRNMGTYRAGLKANDRLGVRMATRLGGAGGYQHWLKYKEARASRCRSPSSIGCGAGGDVHGTAEARDRPGRNGGGRRARRRRRCACASARPSISRYRPIAEIVIEGLIDTELLEPEGPFGESHGYIALEEFNMSMRVTAITHRRKPIFVSIISQVTPSEFERDQEGRLRAAVPRASARTRWTSRASAASSCTSRCRTCGR